MATRPNFTDAQLINGKVRVEGKSDDDISDLIDIRIVLVQGNRISAGTVPNIQAVWHAELPAAATGAFQVGDAVAFGIETRSTNLLTMTWTQPVQIR
jgi:hypothetical protein